MPLLLEPYHKEIVSALLAFIVGILLEKYTNKKPNISYFILNSSQFNLPAQAGNQSSKVFTHSIVIQNNGKAPATNIEVVHFNLNPAPVLFIYQISPDGQYTEDKTQNGGLILRFPSLLPSHQIAISVPLYSYPYGTNNIHNYVKSTEVFGYPISILTVRHTPKWLQLMILWLSLFGFIYALELLWTGLVIFIKFISKM